MQTETTQRKLTWWGVNVLVLLYAFIPVVWIVSLSLKDAATLNDGKYLPRLAERGRATRRSSRTRTSCGRCSTRSASA